MEKILVEQLVDQQKTDLLIPNRPAGAGPWALWECEPSAFDWHYDQKECAYIYAGKVVVRTKEQEVEINAGDYVTFPAGLDCKWIVKEKIKKVYKFE